MLQLFVFLLLWWQYHESFSFKRGKNLEQPATHPMSRSRQYIWGTKNLWRFLTLSIVLRCWPTSRQLTYFSFQPSLECRRFVRVWILDSFLSRYRQGHDFLLLFLRRSYFEVLSSRWFTQIGSVPYCLESFLVYYILVEIGILPLPCGNRPECSVNFLSPDSPLIPYVQGHSGWNILWSYCCSDRESPYSDCGSLSGKLSQWNHLEASAYSSRRTWVDRQGISLLQLRFTVWQTFSVEWSGSFNLLQQENMSR